MTANRLPRWFVVLLSLGPATALVVFYAWPFVTLVFEAVGAQAVADTLTRRSTWDVVWFTTWQAVVSTGLTLVAGLAPAHLVARYEFRGRRLLVGLHPRNGDVDAVRGCPSVV